MPFFLVADPPRAEGGRVQIWATPYPSQDAALAHAQHIDGPCLVIEATGRAQAIQRVWAGHAPS
jgi:hypothetical protein